MILNVRTLSSIHFKWVCISFFFFSSIPSSITRSAHAHAFTVNLRNFHAFYKATLYNVIIVLIVNKFRCVCQNESKQVFGAITINKYATFIFMFIYIFILFCLIGSLVCVLGCLFLCVLVYVCVCSISRDRNYHWKRFLATDTLALIRRGINLLGVQFGAEPETLNK